MSEMPLIKMVGDTQYVRGDAVDAKVSEKDAEIERLRKALEQACASPYWLRAPLVPEDVLPEHPELAAYLRERDSRPPESGVQSGVQSGGDDEGGSSMSERYTIEGTREAANLDKSQTYTVLGDVYWWNDPSNSWMSDTCPFMINHERMEYYVMKTKQADGDLVAEKDAEIERLRTLILAFVNGVDEYDHNGRQRDEEFRDIFSSLAKTGAAYLRERGSRPPTGGEA